MIAYLIAGLQSAVAESASRRELERHLDGIAAIMESHFRYEEHVLTMTLQTLELDVDPRRVLGPL